MTFWNPKSITIVNICIFHPHVASKKFQKPCSSLFKKIFYPLQVTIPNRYHERQPITINLTVLRPNSGLLFHLLEANGDWLPCILTNWTLLLGVPSKTGSYRGMLIQLGTEPLGDKLSKYPILMKQNCCNLLWMTWKGISKVLQFRICEFHDL